MRIIELYPSRRNIWPLIVPGKVVVEVGVFKGDNARDILSHEPAHLYMVTYLRASHRQVTKTGTTGRR